MSGERTETEVRNAEEDERLRRLLGPRGFRGEPQAGDEAEEDDGEE